MHPLSSLFTLPFRIRQDILVYTFPLFLMNLSRTDNKQYSDAIIGSLIALFICNRIYSKTMLNISSILYVIQIFVPSMYFYSYGFILHQAYNNNIIISKEDVSNRLIVKIEILGWILSEVVEIPRLIRLILGGMAVIISLRSDPPSLETEDPYESIKRKIDQPKLLNIEYRQTISRVKDKNRERWSKSFSNLTPFLIEPLYMISDRKTLLLFCSFFSFEYSQILTILTGILFAFDSYWECGIILQKTGGSRIGFVRCIWSYVIYKVIGSLKKVI